MRKYEFSWDLLGDIETGRPNLGANTRVEVYRLMQFTLRDVIEQTHGAEQADKLFYSAGELAGEFFHQAFFSEITDPAEFIKLLKDKLLLFGIGVLRIESMDLVQGELILTISEDLDCSGLPELDYEICTYDEGFLAGLLKSFFGKSFEVKEIDCWCTGDRTCRFKAKAI